MSLVFPKESPKYLRRLLDKAGKKQKWCSNLSVNSSSLYFLHVPLLLMSNLFARDATSFRPFSRLTKALTWFCHFPKGKKHRPFGDGHLFSHQIEGKGRMKIVSAVTKRHQCVPSLSVTAQPKFPLETVFSVFCIYNSDSLVRRMTLLDIISSAISLPTMLL